LSAVVQRLDNVTVFLDRDGTLNHDSGYIACPEEFELYPGAAAALARLNLAGARLILVTNQSGIGRGKLTVADLDDIHEKLRHQLELQGARLDGIYFCPHHPDDACVCRKPAVGMAERAIADLKVVTSSMYLIGDQSCDIEMAKRLKARSIFVTTGRDSAKTLQHLNAIGLRPQHVAPCLASAVDWIFHDAKSVHDGQSVTSSASLQDREQ